MAITEADVKLLQSERMTDTADGGGIVRGNAPIQDGASNSIFPDISELDRSYGRVNLRKLFPAVQTQDQDTYYGAHVILEDAPDDPRVAASVFTTGNWTDERAGAVSNLESYLARGPKAEYWLYETHITGQRSLLCLARTDGTQPRVGETIMLSNDQFVRVTAVEAEERSFFDAERSAYFTRKVLAIEISDALTSDIGGSLPQQTDDANYPSARIYTTIVADAARYYSVKGLTEAASFNDLQVKVSSIYHPLVPSAQTETPIVNTALNGEVSPVRPSALAPKTYTAQGAEMAPNGRLVIQSGVAPGTLSFTVGGITCVDDGVGGITRSGAIIGAIDYGTGEIAFDASAPSASGSVTVTYTPGVQASQQGHTLSREVLAETRALSWVLALAPIPTPGTLTVAYMANGNWYTLTDDGTGAVKGSDPSLGAGSLSFVTGTLSVTLGALPDVGSQIICTWAAGVHYESYGSTAAGNKTDIDPLITWEHDLGEPLEPGSLMLSWISGGANMAALAGVDGEITGDATGYVSSVTGRIELAFGANMPDTGTLVGIDYEADPVQSQVFTSVTESGGIATFNLGVAVKPGSVRCEFATVSKSSYTEATAASTEGKIIGGTANEYIRLYRDAQTEGTRTRLKYNNRVEDDGAGGFIARAGSINYVNGQFTLAMLPVVKERAYSTVVEDWRSESNASLVAFESGVVTIYWIPAGQATTSRSITVAPPQVAFNVFPRLQSETAVPGSLVFKWNGVIYVERAGKLYRDIDPLNGSGTEAGTFDPVSGQVVLTNYDAGGGDVDVQALLVVYGSWQTTQSVFRTPIAPIKPQSLTIMAVTADGTQITATADGDGVISGTNVTGVINYEFGVGAIEFTDGVNPVAVFPETLIYNAVAYSYLPLNADILGINTVRLPSDGRVVIFRPGDIVVVHHNDTITGSYANGDTQDCGRTRLARVRITDADGTTVDNEHYSVNLDTGEIAFISVTGYTQPLTIEHRIEDMALCSDAQLDGTLTLTRPLTHDFPMSSLVSSALIIGDMVSRYANLFEQATWSGAWSDSLSGGEPTASYNDAIFPVLVDNAGAIQERWALIFTSTTQVRVVGESVGQIAESQSIAGPIAPTNPATGRPYFQVDPGGWGSGWSVGNVLRFNTLAANYPIWVARTIQQGPATEDSDTFCLQVRGDIDTEGE